MTVISRRTILGGSAAAALSLSAAPHLSAYPRAPQAKAVLAPTPPMGWNSWNAWRHWVDDARIRSAAEALVKTGLAARGYSYVNIDSCWQGERGGKHGAIQPNRK